LGEALHEAGEHFAAGFLEQAGAAPLTRMARGLCRQWERAALPRWRGEALYPAGAYSWAAQGSAVRFHYSHSLVVDQELLAQRGQAGEERHRCTYTALAEQLGRYPQVGAEIDRDISLGGANYTHAVVNYGRVVRDGLARYAERVAQGLARAQARGDSEQRAFFAALQELMEGIRTAHARSVAALRAAEPAAAEPHAAWARLLAALERVPWQPARTFYEGLVAVNWLYYLDGCDSLGRFDQDLGPLYEADLAAGHLDEATGTAWVGELWANMDANTGWNVAIGGSHPDGSDASNRLTLACLRAVQGRRRPNLALRLTTTTPEPVWEAALDAIASGCGLPALYNDALYLQAMREAHLNIAPQDLARFAFGGCTELMIHGCSNVGSLDAGLNLPLILAATLREHLPTATSFDQVWATFQADLITTVARLVRQVNEAQEHHARFQPQPLRTLLMDDCLDAGVEFNAGGARYNWSVVNVGGLANVADALAALREVVYERHEVDGLTLASALRADYLGYEALRQRLQRAPRYGNDDPRADELARQISELVFRELRRYAPWRGGRFLPGCLMFVTYARAGEPVMATPDGRHAGEPIADSIGAVAGRDRRGPTALIRSVASLPQQLAPGTLVTNFRFARTMFTGESRAKLQELLRAYFALGGMQAQLTVVDQEVLHQAVAHPDEYADLIVRVGGYSEYWRNLTPTLQQSILERTEHTC
jgi:formate C-acetyltransferase